MAQYHLGFCYANSQGVEKDYAEAAIWWRKAAEQGIASAQRDLGVCYTRGDGVIKDAVEAAKWYSRAASQGDAKAQANLGVCYDNGDGVPKDFVKAYEWINLAAAQGDHLAKEYRSTLVYEMTPEQIAEAQELSREFRPCKESGSDNSTSPDNPTATGTGFFITDDGCLISNYHVVKDATKVRLLTSAGLIDAKVVSVDAANDLALLKADGKFSPLPIAASRTVNLGGTVATVGFPDIGLQGFAPKLAKGEIASLSGASDDPRYFQISVPVQPGNSGGALVDERGNVIGIVSAKLDASAALAASGALPENVNYAVKSSFLLSFLESVPAVSAKLKAPNTKDEKFEKVVKSAQDAAVLVLVY
jgi:S1-C subfamily serine protease